MISAIQTFTVQTGQANGEWIACVTHYPGALDTVADLLAAGSEEGTTHTEGRADREDVAVANAFRENLHQRIAQEQLPPTVVER